MKYFEPSEELKKEIELEVPTVLQAHFTAQNNTCFERQEQFNTFTNEIKTRVRTSLEREAIKIEREIKKSLEASHQTFKIPNEENRLEIKFILAFK